MPNIFADLIFGNQQEKQNQALAAYGQKHFPNNPEIADLFTAAPELAVQMLPKIMEGVSKNNNESALAALASGNKQQPPTEIGQDSYRNNMVMPQQDSQQPAYQNPMDYYLEAANRDPQAFHAAASPELFKQVSDYAMKKQESHSILGAADSNLTGDEYLATLPKDMQTTVKAIAEGRMAMPTGNGSRSKYGQALQQAVNNYDPTADAATIAGRFATRKGFTAGKEAQSVNALNTVMEHLGQLKDNADAMQNVGFTPWNAVANFTGRVLGSDKQTNFESNALPVAQELTRAYRGAGGAEADIQGTLKTLNSNSSPEQFKGAFATLAELLKGKQDALADQYKRGMGTVVEDKDFYTPESISALAKMGIGDAPAKENVQPLIKPETRQKLLEAYRKKRGGAE